MFEMLTMFCFYAQATLDDRLVLIYNMYLDDPEKKDTMTFSEMQFCIEKFGLILSSTLSLQKDFLQ